MVGELDLIDDRSRETFDGFEKCSWVADATEGQSWFTCEMIQREFLSRGISPAQPALGFTRCTLVLRFARSCVVT